MTQFRLGEPLPADVLSRIDALPLQPDPLTLTGRFVRLEPLDIARDAQPLHR